MVKRIEAYEASDGTVFGTEADAHRHDAHSALKDLGIFQEGTIQALLREPHAVCDILCPLSKALPRAATEVASHAING